MLTRSAFPDELPLVNRRNFPGGYNADIEGALRVEVLQASHGAVRLRVYVCDGEEGDGFVYIDLPTMRESEMTTLAGKFVARANIEVTGLAE